MSKPEPPATLADAGREVWNSIAAKYDLRADELVTLEDICAFSDEIAELTAEWEADGKPRKTKGSMGQLVEHPDPKRIADLRMKRNALWRQLKLPDDASAAVTTNPARAAASSRWKHGS